jgi:hypothetical protein
MKLRPWVVPNFAVVETPPRKREEGFREAPTIPLADLDPGVLAAMCSQFRAAVFAKAGKADPDATP